MFEQEMTERLKTMFPDGVPAATAPLTLAQLEQSAKDLDSDIADLLEKQNQIRTGSNHYNGPEIARQLETVRRQRADIGGRLLGARSEAEAKQFAEYQHQQAELTAQAKETALRDRYRAAWSGTDASFNAAWPGLLADHLKSEARNNLDSLKQKMRAHLGI